MMADGSKLSLTCWGWMSLRNETWARNSDFIRPHVRRIHIHILIRSFHSHVYSLKSHKSVSTEPRTSVLLSLLSQMVSRRGREREKWVEPILSSNRIRISVTYIDRRIDRREVVQEINETICTNPVRPALLIFLLVPLVSSLSWLGVNRGIVGQIITRFEVHNTAPHIFDFSIWSWESKQFWIRLLWSYLFNISFPYSLSHLLLSSNSKRASSSLVWRWLFQLRSKPRVTTLIFPRSHFSRISPPSFPLVQSLLWSGRVRMSLPLAAVCSVPLSQRTPLQVPSVVTSASTCTNTRRQQQQQEGTQSYLRWRSWSKTIYSISGHFLILCLFLPFFVSIF